MESQTEKSGRSGERESPRAVSLAAQLLIDWLLSDARTTRGEAKYNLPSIDQPSQRGNSRDTLTEQIETD